MTTGEEKLNYCKHRSVEPKEVFDGCPCKGIKKLIFTCEKKLIENVLPQNCEGCELFENKFH
jgi:hypothetical protein